MQEGAMATTAQQTDYLYQPQVPWCRDLVRDVLEPWRQRSLAHPFYAALSAGQIPRQTLAALHGDVLWVVTAFPEYIAGFASRCPKYDHAMKAKLLENAYEERTHPRLLADVVNALGGPGDAILDDPEWTYEPGDWAWHTRNWLECCAFHLPWIEGLAGTAVGIEAIVPTIFWPIMQALRAHYGLTDAQLTWHEIHSGEVEQTHGNNGLRLLEKYVDPADRVMVTRCRRAVDRTCRLQSQEFLDYWWARAQSA
jgi:pyrroloquinoline quinone (PQQ) biosynthesis protein C